jgi:hypothetical protein
MPHALVAKTREAGGSRQLAFALLERLYLFCHGS